MIYLYTDLTKKGLSDYQIKKLCKEEKLYMFKKGAYTTTLNYNKDLYDSLDKEVEVVEEKTTYKNEELTNEDKIWDEIIRYARNRKVLADIALSEEELDRVYIFIVALFL